MSINTARLPQGLHYSQYSVDNTLYSVYVVQSMLFECCIESQQPCMQCSTYMDEDGEMYTLCSLAIRAYCV